MQKLEELNVSNNLIKINVKILLKFYNNNVKN